MNTGEIDVRVARALDKFWEQERILLEYGLNEQTIAGSLMVHLRNQFPEFDVDVEYNRKSGQNGLTNESKNVDPATLGRGTGTIKPDIIVHRRGTDKENIAVFEIKSLSGRKLAAANLSNTNFIEPGSWEVDRKRLSALQGRYHYDRTFFLVFPTGVDCGIELLKKESN